MVEENRVTKSVKLQMFQPVLKSDARKHFAFPVLRNEKGETEACCCYAVSEIKSVTRFNMMLK